MTFKFFLLNFDISVGLKLQEHLMMSKQSRTKNPKNS